MNIGERKIWINQSLNEILGSDEPNWLKVQRIMLLIDDYADDLLGVTPDQLAEIEQEIKT